jgi:hypothetical protein
MGNAIGGSDETIWRYMDLAKFVLLLDSRSIWFARANTFEDPAEVFSRIVPYRIPKQQRQVDRVWQEFITATDGWLASLPKRMYISCWTRGKSQSVALWKLYSSDTHGIAVRTTAGRFRASLQLDETDRHLIRCARVRYTQRVPTQNFNKHARLGIELATEISTRKDPCYRYENEWRAILYRPESESISGVAVRADLSKLIQEVWLSPLADSLFTDAVRSITAKYGLKIAPKQSTLRQPPKRLHPIRQPQSGRTVSPRRA